MENSQKYNKNKYNIEYKKQNYKRFVMELKPEFKEEIQRSAEGFGVTASAFVTACIRYCIDNKIDILL